MIRILIFLLSILLVAAAGTYFAYLDSRIAGEAFGMKFDAPSGIVVGALILAFLAAIYITHKVKDIMAMPAKLRAREEASRRARGVAALTRGLEAAAVGDAADAAHHARIAQRHLDDLALTRLLTAQAAQLSGDQAAAKASYTAMLEAPETEFLGLKGLYLQAMAEGDAERAREYAEKAFRLRSNAQWAFDSVIELGLERGAWGEMREAVAQGRRNNLLPADKADRATAALLTVDAYAASAGEDEKTALKELDAALKLAPGFAPAAVLAARLHADGGRTAKAAKIIEAAFAQEPHPALIRLYDRLYADEASDKRAERLRRLAEKNPEAREAAMLKTLAHNLLGEWAEAATALEPLLTETPTAFEYALMAEAAAGLSGPEAARVWLEKVAGAPRDPRPGADGAFHFKREGWARLVREYMEYGRLAPPPLEDAAAGVTAEEIRLLTAPPLPDVAEDEPDAAEGVGEMQTATPDVERAAPSPDAPASDAPLPEAASEQDGDHIHDDAEGERVAAAAREVS